MICYCPHCMHQLPESLVDGVTFCENCSRIINSNKIDELVSAYKLILKNKYTSYEQLKYHLQLEKKDLDFLVYCYEEENHSADDFVKIAKANYSA